MINPQDIFFLIVLGTIIIIRVWLLFFKIGSPILSWVKMHHYMYGLTLLALGILYSNLILYGIGFAFVVDEIPPLLRYGNSFGWKEYDSKFSRIGVIVCLLLIYLFRGYMLFI